MAATSTSDLNAAITATSTTTDGPVLNLINKRLRALRKKLNRIVQMEESLSQGKTLNKEQQEVLRSKTAVVVLIDELEKLRAPISTAVEEEIEIAIAQSQSQRVTVETAPFQEEKKEDRNASEVVEDLLNVLYFGSLFDVKPQGEFTAMMLARTHERDCCLTYDYVPDDATDILGHKDLDLIAAMQGLIVSRPGDLTVSHKDALQRCIEHAKLWIGKSDQPISQDTDVTYAALREKLNKIMGSDYFTASAEIRAPVPMAAAAESFGNFQVPVHGSMIPVQVEGTIGQYQESEQNTVTPEEYETGDSQSSPVEEVPKDESETENPNSEVPVDTEHANLQEPEGEQNPRDIDPKHQYVPRRNQRGGGSGGRRGGYPNGRGGRGGSGGGRGGYQNGRRGQYYDNGYYPRNSYYRGRGGRGGGNPYDHANNVKVAS